MTPPTDAFSRVPRRLLPLLCVLLVVPACVHAQLYGTGCLAMQVSPVTGTQLPTGTAFNVTLTFNRDTYFQNLYVRRMGVRVRVGGNPRGGVCARV